MDDKNAEEIKTALVRIDTHVEQLGARMDKHDERLSRAEADIIEERGVRQGMERAMNVEHARLNDKIDSLGERLWSGIDAIRLNLRDHTDQEDQDRRVMMRLLWSTLIGVVLAGGSFLFSRVVG